MNWLDVPEKGHRAGASALRVIHPHADLDPVRTALIVIDLQNAFMDEAVGHAVCPMAREIAPTVNRLDSVVRASRGGVFWIKMIADERSAREWSNVNAMLTAESRAQRVAALSEGSKGQELCSDLDMRPEDEIVRKYRFSAFVPATWPYRLSARGFDTVLIAGTVTNVCCETSALDANDDELQDRHGAMPTQRGPWKSTKPRSTPSIQCSAM
jgi:ureidoacrylate peracid hydrolase